MRVIIYKICDLSTHNGDVDFEKLKKSVDGVIIRAGFGQNNIDKHFESNIKNAIKHNLHIGVYWFGYAYTIEQAKQEAESLLNILKKYPAQIDLPIFYDWEYDSYSYAKQHGVTVTKQLCSEITSAFLNVLEKNGYYAGFYANLDYLNTYYTDTVKERYAVWVAQWNGLTETSYKGQFGIWQYTSKGKIDGVKDYVDLNYCYIDYPDKIRKLGFNGYKSQVNDIYKKTIEVDMLEYNELKKLVEKLYNYMN